MDAVQKKSIKKGLLSLKYTGAASQSVVLAQIFGKERLPLIKQLYDQAGSFVKFIQMDRLISDIQLLKRWEDQEKKTGKLHPMFHQVDRNVINLTSKMRKQDEGIKVAGEIVHTHDDIRNLVESSKRMIINVETIEQQKTIVRSSSIFKDSTMEK